VEKDDDEVSSSPPPATSVKRASEETPPCPRRPWSPLPQVATARAVSKESEEVEEEVEEEVKEEVEHDDDDGDEEEMHRIASAEEPRRAVASRASCDRARLDAMNLSADQKELIIARKQELPLKRKVSRFVRFD
jgi:hypothetical protein